MFFKLGFRVFKKFLPVKIVSVLILSIGTLFFLMASSIFIKEIEFNNKLKDSGRIFRINTRFQFTSGAVQNLSVSPAIIGPYLKDNLPDIEDQARLWKQSTTSLTAKNENFFGEDIVSVDSSFFAVFNFSVIRGALEEFRNGRPDVAVLSELMAKRLFGSSNPIGQEITIGKAGYTVSAVIRASDTDIDHEVFIPINEDIDEFEWIETFVLFSETSKGDIANQINGVLETPMSGEYNDDVMKISFHPLSLSEMRFQEALFAKASINKLFLYFLMSIAIVLMSLCCLSVLNFEGTISLNRVKEVSIRKMFGCHQYQILYQFMVENFVVFLFSLPVVLVSFYLLLPTINSAWTYKLSITDVMHPYSITLLVIFVGTYIALMTLVNYRLYMKNGSIQKNSRSKQPAFTGITRFLLPFQIFICVLVLCFTSLSSHQVKHLSKIDVGFVHQDVYIVDINGANTEGVAKYLKEYLLQESGVSLVSQVNRQSIPGRDAEIQLFTLNDNDADQEIACQLLFVDEDYFDVLGIGVLSGKRPLESGEQMINSNLVKKQTISVAQENTLNGVTVTGEVANYYHDGLFSSLKPIVFKFEESNFNALLVKVSPSFDLAELQKAVNDFVRAEKFEVQATLSPLKDVYFSRQSSDYRLMDVIRLCNYFIMLITILGILSSTNMVYNTLLRQNVIRKVHGASNIQILKHSGKLIYFETLIAFILSIILSHFIYFEWQSRYVVKVPMWIGAYLPLASFMIISVIVFTFYFLARIRKVKLIDAL